ncbi:MAG: tetratricopeptide repeat protein [Kofleriaceae bacterium]
MADFVVGDDVDAAVRSQILDHMATCGACRQSVAALTRELPQKRAGALARYHIDRVVGEGAFGVVLAGRDLELDRPVAIKIAKAPRPVHAGDDEARARFVREARALAQLAHPNVVTIYDAGIVDAESPSAEDNELFIVMELIEGGTLRDWLVQQPRTWRQIVEMFVAAGRGLAAAHDLGLVHRDFKPANVLVGTDQRPRVSDFGLVRLEGHATELIPTIIDTTALGSPITRTGGVVGTPRYMAPEQLEAGPVDARADQYAFARSLHEALFARPGAPVRRVPARIRRALERALQHEPAARFPTIAQLLAALQHATRRWPRALAAVAVLGVLTGGFAGVVAAGERERVVDPCMVEASELWSAAQRDSLANHLARSGAPHITEAIDRIDGALTRYAADWSQTYGSACRAARVAQKPFADRSAQHACLGARRADIAALLNAASELRDERIAASITTIANELPPAHDCLADTSADVPRPASAAGLVLEGALRQLLFRSRLLATLTRQPEALALAEQVTNLAQAPGLDTIRAEAWRAMGITAAGRKRGDRAEAALLRSAEIATAIDDKRLAAQAWVDLMHVRTELRADRPGARAAANTADALLKTNPVATITRVIYHYYLADLDATSGSLANAEAGLRAAIALRSATFQGPDARMGQLLTVLASYQMRQGRLAESETTSEAALEALRSSLGNYHPSVASALRGLGATAAERGNFEQAHRYLKEALAIQDAYPDDAKLGAVVSAICTAYIKQLRYAEAQPVCERAYAVQRRWLPPGHRSLSTTLNNLAAIARTQSRLADAERYLRMSVDIERKSGGDRHPHVGIALSNLSLVLALQGAHDEAAAMVRDAVAINEAAYGTNHPLVAAMLGRAGDVAFVGHRYAAAVELYARQLAVLDRVESGASTRANARFWMGKSMWEAHDDRPRAIALVRKARDELVASKEQANLEELDQWLAAHKR